MFSILSKLKGNTKSTDILEFSQKEGLFKVKASYNNVVFLNGAVASCTSALYVSGSKVGKSKACALVDIT
jgi:hypothetical protein